MAKRHHYVPVTYLRAFTDAKGQVIVDRKDEPERPFPQRPEATGFERYYYSLNGENGERDDDQFEAIFSQVETHWPEIVEALGNKLPLFPLAPRMIEFLAVMRVRGPAFRDAAELHLSNVVQAEVKLLHDAGELPPAPEEMPDILDKLQIAIDPQKSLEAMVDSVRGMGDLLSILSYEVLHNASGVPFLTSDNPVMYFNPDVPDVKMLPYTVRPPMTDMELLFPVTPTMMLRGRLRPRRSDIGHRTLVDRKRAKRYNRLIARFAYRVIFASERGHDAVISNEALLSPVVDFEHLQSETGARGVIGQFVFGPRPLKPRWKGPT